MALVMFSVLLVFLGSEPAQAVDERSKFPEQFTASPKGVNIQTGRFNYSATDLSIGDLKLTRFWGDQSAVILSTTARAFGVVGSYAQQTHGWNHLHNQGVGPASADGRFKVIVEGQTYQFALTSAGPIVPIGRASSGTNLRSVGGAWRFTDKAGSEYVFFAHPAIDQLGISTNPRQVLASITRPDGTVLTYSYRTNAQLEEVRSNRGYAIHFDYNASNNIVKACGYSLAQTWVAPSTPCQAGATSVIYGYDAGGTNLTSVTSASGEVVQITHYSFTPTAFAPTCITFANSATCEITNTYYAQYQPVGCLLAMPNQVTKQVTASGGTWEYCYEPPPNPVDQPTLAGQPRWSYAWMTEPNGASHELTYDRGRLVDHVGPQGTLNYKYPATVIVVPYNYGLSNITFEFMDTSPGMVTLADGNWQYFVYDPRGNIMLRSLWPLGSPDPLLENGSPALSSDPDLRRCCITPGNLQIPAGSVTVGEAYLPSYSPLSPYVTGCGAGEPDAKRCDKPIARIDERGSQTDLTYDPAHGGILTETGPPVDGIRPQTRYTYAQRYAWIKNSGGAFVQDSTPVWLLTEKSTCKTGAAGAGCALGASDEVRTTYDYGPNSGPNTLLLRGMVEDDGGLNLRTCYGYDAQGNRISETRPEANLASCP